MNINFDVPFVPNEPDDLHCYSASLTMILGHFVPEMPLRIEIGNRISSKSEKTAWPLAAPLWLQRRGFDVGVTFDFDYEAVAEQGVAYIRSRYGDEVAAWQEANTDIPDSTVVRSFLAEVAFQKRIPDLEDVRTALKEKRLVAVTVNSSVLKGELGYVNHSVVVKGITDDEVILHNPGLPPVPEQVVGLTRFIDAWSFPTADARYLMSVGRSLKCE